MKRKALSILISILLAFALIQSSFAAWAGELERVHYGECTVDEYGNSEYNEKTVFVRRGFFAISSDLKSYRYVENLAEAQLYVRDCMKALQKNINFYFPHCDEESNGVNIRALIDFCRAYDVSADCNDGDYLYMAYVKASWHWDDILIDGELYTAVNYSFSYRSTPEKEAFVNEKIPESAEALKGETDLETVKNIHDYICESVTYYNIPEGESVPEKELVYTAMTEHRVVCGGYALFFYRLAKQLGFDVRVVYCQPLNHAWNIIELGGKWYFIDCTWDDYDNAVDSDNSTVTEQNTVYDEFLKGKSDFLNHGAISTFTVGATAEKAESFDIADTAYALPECEEHSFELFKTVNAPCSELYFNVYKCALCGATKREPAQKSEHLPSEYTSTVAPSCTMHGAGGSSYCATCRKLLSPREYIAPLGHDIREEVTPATTSADGVVKSHCERCGERFEDRIVNYVSTVKLSKSKYYYNGKGQKPYLLIIDSEGHAVPAASYKVTYPADIKTPGKHTVIVDFGGYYSGSVKLTYEIALNTTYIKKYTYSKNYIKLYWKKAASVTGYQVQYSTDKSFKRGVKTLKIKGAKNTLKKITKLKSKKKYYLRIRTYKTIGGRTYYSKWGNKAKVKTA